MKFSKNLLGSDFLCIYKISASYRVPFRPLNGVTCRGQKFFFLNSHWSKVSRHFSSKRKRVYSSVIRQKKAYDGGEVPFRCLDFLLPWHGTRSRPKVLNFHCLSPYNHLESSQYTSFMHLIKAYNEANCSLVP